LAISERKLWELQNAGVIPVIRYGRLVRFRRSDLDVWIAAHRKVGRK
jgi:excisionase family DNA binding protein